MKIRWIYFLVLAASLVMHEAFSQTTTDTLRGDIFGLGRGFAAGVAVGLPAIQSNAMDGEQRVIHKNGLRVVVWRSKEGILPLSVEASSPAAIRSMNKELAETTPTDVVPNFGKPEAQTKDSFRLRGPSEACEEFLDLTFRQSVLVSAKWTFCIE